MCTPPNAASCGEALQGYAVFLNEQNQFQVAGQLFEQSLSLARDRGDRFLEATSLLNLGAVMLDEGRFDEAVDRSEAASEAAKGLQAGDLEMAAQQNLAWAAYRLGDSERALDLLVEADKRAASLGDVFLEENALTDIGYIHMDARRFDVAETFFRRALSLAKPGNGAGAYLQCVARNGAP